MRKHLLQSFDKIYILDLHGNAKKKEVCPDGSADQNVFDIMQGVSINLFVKTGKKKKNELAQVFHFDLFGKRDLKYEYLIEKRLSSIDWNEFMIKAPNYFFIEKNIEEDISYNNGFNLSELFIQNSSGIETRKDYLVIAFEEVVLRKVIEDFRTLSQEDISQKYKVNNDSRDWKIEWAKNDILANNPKIENILQKPFDNRKIIYTGKTKGINGYPMYNNFKHFLNKDNLGLISKRGRLLGSNNEFSHISITKKITDKNFLADQSYVFPLYLYPETTAQQRIEPAAKRSPNLNAAIVNQIAEKLGLIFTNEKETAENTFAPIDILDYIYAVLHSPTYREKYKEFLKIDFPRVPYPKDTDTFWKLVKLGGEIRQIHLLESPTVAKYITQYPIDGNNVIGKTRFDAAQPDGLGKVYINDTQYFDNVPRIAWDFYIGGYQPAQKWLKDRKERKLEFEDILHYQKIIVALTETDRIMKEIDLIEIE
jgi:predicted helicase